MSTNDLDQLIISIVKYKEGDLYQHFVSIEKWDKSTLWYLLFLWSFIVTLILNDCKKPIYEQADLPLIIDSEDTVILWVKESMLFRANLSKSKDIAKNGDTNSGEIFASSSSRSGVAQVSLFKDRAAFNDPNLCFFTSKKDAAYFTY